MKYFTYLTSTALTGLLLFGMAGCVSTDIIEPSKNKEKEGELILNLSTPDDILTRADNNYKLRFVAKIFEGSSTIGYGEMLQRQEISQGDKSENGVENQMIFKVEPNNDYTLMVFADYIPIESKASSEGFYPDYHYNTNIDYQTRTVMMYTTPKSKMDVVSADFFNNDNYDCFFEMETFEKTELEKIIDMTLKRITSKVIFRDNSDKTDYTNVEIKNITLGNQFAFLNNQATFYDEFNINNASLGILPQDKAEDSKDILYFYTLSNFTTNDRNQKASIEFILTNSANATSTFTVSDIPVKRNYKTIVNGNYLSAFEADPLPDTGNTGDIILNVSTENDWELEPLTK